MKLIYVASPYAGDIEGNIEFAKLACRYVMEQGHACFAPHLLYPQFLNDAILQERQVGLDMGLAILAKCDEVWICGDRISAGMQAEIDMAKQFDIPVHNVSTEQIIGAKTPVYTIWAKAYKDGPLAGHAGFLCENRKVLFFSSEDEANIRIRDIKNLCMNNSPVAEYTCVKYPIAYASRSRMHLETLRELDIVPAFTSDRFEVKSQVYGNTGGQCMVGTVQFYLPELDKSVWVNCNDECVVITSADYMWNEDGSESWERYEDVTIFTAFFRQGLPEDIQPWLHMIHKALEYTIQQETAYFKGSNFSLPTVWLPESILQHADHEHLEWLCAKGEEAQITHDGSIKIDEDYPQSGQGSINKMETL